MPTTNPKRAKHVLEHPIPPRATIHSHPPRERISKQQNRRESQPTTPRPVSNNDRQPPELAAANRVRLPLPVPLRNAPIAVLRDVVRPRPRPATPTGHRPRAELERFAGASHAPPRPAQAHDIARGHFEAGGASDAGPGGVEGVARGAVRERGGDWAGPDAGVLRVGQQGAAEEEPGAVVWWGGRRGVRQCGGRVVPRAFAADGEIESGDEDEGKVSVSGEVYG